MTDPAPEPPSAAMPRGKKALYGVVAVVGLLALLECALWLVGVQPISERDDAFHGFSASVPHFVESEGVVRRAPGRETVLNPIEFSARKSDSVTRIFCVGGSTTYGRPYFDETSFSGFLREFLAAADTSGRYEVLNAGAISYASYRVAGVMRELAAYEPDVFVIYTGQNEFLEARTYASMREVPQWIRNAAGAVSGTRTGTLITSAVLGGTTGPEGIGDDVRIVPVDAAGPESYRRDDAWRATVIHEFRLSLGAMLDIAERAGARVILVVPESNVADFEPFRSQPSDGLSEADARRFHGLMMSGLAALKDGRVVDAESALRQATELDNRHASAWFLLGRALLAQDRIEEATVALRRAIDEDVCTLRAPRSIQAAVREIAAARGVGLVDFSELLASGGERGIPGDGEFADHVHPFPETNSRLAAALLGRLAGLGIATSSVSWARSGAVEPASRRVLEGIDRTKYADELSKLSYVMGTLGHPTQSRLRALDAARLRGGSAAALLESAAVLESCPDLMGAAELVRRALEVEPGSAEMRLRLARLLLGAGNREAATVEFERALALDPNLVGAHARLGVLRAESGDLDSAERHFRELVRLRPDAGDSHYNLGLVLMKRGRAGAAREAFVEALRLEPGHSGAQEQLDKLAGKR